MVFVPMVHRTSRLVEVVREEGIFAFRPNPSEHPHINYVHMPIRGLFELGRLVEGLGKRLAHVRCPVLVLQGDRDPVVDSGSAALLFRALGSRDKVLRLVPSDRHGILYEVIVGTWHDVLAFAERLDAPVAPGT